MRLSHPVPNALLSPMRPQMTLATRDFMMLRWRQFMVMSLALAGTFWWLKTTYKDQVVSVVLEGERGGRWERGVCHTRTRW